MGVMVLLVIIVALGLSHYRLLSLFRINQREQEERTLIWEHRFDRLDTQVNEILEEVSTEFTTPMNELSGQLENLAIRLEGASNEE